MKYKDYYETLGVPRSATQDEIKQAYRKAARKYHPDVSKLADAEARFKEINEANEVLRDPEKRAAYDQMGSNWKAGQEFQPPPNWDAGFEFRGGQGSPFGAGGTFSAGGDFDPSDFFETLFGRRGAGAAAGRRRASAQGEDHHAKVLIDVEDAYRGAERTISLRAPIEGPDGRVEMQERTLDVHIPKGIRPGQHLRLAGQGNAGIGGGKPGDLYLEIAFNPHSRFRVDGADVYVDLPLAPWEAALGATVDVPTPDGAVQLTVPNGSAAGRKLRLKGRGLPGKNPGDFYAVLAIVVPKAESDAARAAYENLAKAFPSFEPRPNS
ncbi:MAG TPA: DnaJ C-terminal domain-containing protein [Caldimonas sp.]|nr:DnaJ C-terminal domain-containing protein [Caldimonas sp.]